MTVFKDACSQVKNEKHFLSTYFYFMYSSDPFVAARKNGVEQLFVKFIVFDECCDVSVCFVADGTMRLQEKLPTEREAVCGVCEFFFR